MRHPPTIVALLAGLFTLAGCGINDPLNNPAASNDRRRTPSANEVVVPIKVRNSKSARAAAAATPVAAIERFARLYINWTHSTLADHQRQLAAISVGEASAMQARAAARTPADYELHRSRVANRGRIVALAPARPARTGTYVVVTRERTLGARTYEGLAPAYHVTIATVQRLGGGWAVSQWRPQI